MRKNSGEDEQDYLVTVKRLSHDADLGTTDYAGRQLSSVLAITSLKNYQPKKRTNR